MTFAYAHHCKCCPGVCTTDSTQLSLAQLVYPPRGSQQPIGPTFVPHLICLCVIFAREHGARSS